MRRPKKPFNPNFPLAFAMVAGMTALLASAACIFLCMHLLFEGASQWVALLPMAPFLLYVISAVAVMTHSIKRYLREECGEPKPKEAESEYLSPNNDYETADYVELPHEEWEGDDTQIGECHANR